MMQNPDLLRSPGPTPIPHSVQLAMQKPMIGRRGEEIKHLLNELKHKIKSVFGTKEDVLFISGSGTSGMEASVVNTCSSNQEVLVIVTGEFGERMAEVCEANQLIVHRMHVEWGSSVNPNNVKDFLKKNRQIKSVFVTFCETSTGVLNPISEISSVVRNYSDALVIVDGVSAIGGVEAKMDEWGVDIFFTASQKAMMLPPGLCFIAVSSRAWKVIESNKQPRYYLDLKKYRNDLMVNATPFTPATSLLFGLKEVLALFEKEGLQYVFQRHKVMTEMLRGAIRLLGMPLLATDQDASPTITTILTEGFNGEELRKQLKGNFGLEVANGINHLKDKSIRIGHMGYCTPADILQIVGLIEIELLHLGIEITPGQGVEVAQKIYLERLKEYGRGSQLG
ncbi:alanine--glyoxylate aminotransferase family protein [Virgibacillus oceani]